MASDLPPPRLAHAYHLARQPILDTRLSVWGYELLFRDKADHLGAHIKAPDFATISVASCGFTRSDELTNQTKKIFINFSDRMIIQRFPRALPPSVTVIEILEDFEPSDELYEAIIELKQEGYLFAVDDFDERLAPEMLLNLADIIKVDVLNKTPDHIRSLYNSIRGKKAIKLAEKVDNKPQAKFLQELGFELFQGYYFAKPENLSGKKLSATSQTKFALLHQMEKPNVEPDELAQAIRLDPSVSYRLLRLLNSAAFSFSVEVTSVRHAIMLLGLKRLKYWLRMVILSDMIGENKSPELYTMALTRARFFELLAPQLKRFSLDGESLFLYGMFSLLEAMLEAPMRDVVKQLPLSDELKEGYTKPKSRLGGLLRLVQALEMADYDTADALSEQLRMDPDQTVDAYAAALVWSGEYASCME